MIKECPFCGAKANLTRNFDGYIHKWYVRCTKCYASATHFFSTDVQLRSTAGQKAIDAWNKRVNDAKQKAEKE